MTIIYHIPVLLAYSGILQIVFVFAYILLQHANKCNR